MFLSYALTSHSRPKLEHGDMNESLLRNKEVLTEVTKEIDFYFQTNNTPDSDPGIFWEAHKAVICGVLIKH